MSDSDNQPKPPQGDLASELRELGQQLETAVRNALQSDKARQVQQDMAAGMQEIGTQMKSALKAIQENPSLQQFVERSEQAVSQAQQSKATHDFQEALARGVAQLNDQLANFITNLSQNTSAQEPQQAPPAEPQQAPPAEEPPPATGETTRLDPDERA